jgi:acetyl-CoA synthetase
MTCSGGDSAQGADESQRRELELPEFAPDTVARLEEVLPTAATAANPLDYTAMIWGDREALAELVRIVGEDPSIDEVLVFYDEPHGMTGAPAESWGAVRDGIMMGAHRSPVPTLVSSTLPELLADASAWRFIEAGIPAIAGLRTGIRAAESIAEPAPAAERAQRLRSIASAAASVPQHARGDGEWLSEHATKAILRDHGIAVVDGRLVCNVDDAVRALDELGGRIVLKLNAALVQHKTELGGVELAIDTPERARSAYQRLAALASDYGDDAGVLAERMASGSVELIVAAHTDGVVPAVIIGLGGIWTEILDDVVVIPLPADAERVQQGLRSLRGAALLTGARGRGPADIAAVASLASALGELLLAEPLEVVECNPVFVGSAGEGALAVDATARRRASVGPADAAIDAQLSAAREVS